MGVQERRFTIPAVLEKIEEACDFVTREAHRAGLSDDAVYHCHLSVEEVLTNVVEHGYKFKGENEVIDVICEPFNDRFVIIVIDDAPQFNPLALPDPDPAMPLWEREGGGWGIYFVKKYMNRVSYKYEINRNYFIMEKFLN